MATQYENLINELKIKLKLKNIGFKKIFNLINNELYEQIIKIVNDDTIQNLINNILFERNTITKNLENKLNDLLWLNEQLIQFGFESQPSKTKALKMLKTININIYDLDAERYDKITTRKLLIKELRKKPERRFRLKDAKENNTLKCFLKKIFK